MSIHDLPDAAWLAAESEMTTNRVFAEHERALADHKEAMRTNQAELTDLASALKKSASDIEKENKELSAFAAEMAQEDEERLASQVETDDPALMRQFTIMRAVDAQTVTGGGPGNYVDPHPYSGWGRWYTHNEGGVTQASANYSTAANKMYPYAHARGDGAGITDDNDATSYVKLYFALWPTRNGHVRAFVPYVTRGYYRIYSNDKWYNSKEAKVDLDFSVQLYQNFWGGYVKDDVFYRFDDNINQSGRIDLTRTLYSGSLAVGANKWVIAEVTVRAHVETEGSGSTGTLSFRGADYIWVPYVRFDFS